MGAASEIETSTLLNTKAPRSSRNNTYRTGVRAQWPPDLLTYPTLAVRARSERVRADSEPRHRSRSPAPYKLRHKRCSKWTLHSHPYRLFPLAPTLLPVIRRRPFRTSFVSRGRFGLIFAIYEEFLNGPSLPAFGVVIFTNGDFGTNLIQRPVMALPAHPLSF